jgi:anti-anti-sigma regulatory factor
MKVSSENKTEHTVLSFAGEIDEDSDFSGIEVGKSASLVIDLDGVTSVNSAGLRSWVRWIKSLTTPRDMVFRHCRRSIVEQMNILQGFLRPGSKIESFYVPYHCEKCGHEEDRLARLHQDYTQGLVDHPEQVRLPARVKCPKCDGALEWDVIEAKYFRFLKYRP